MNAIVTHFKPSKKRRMEMARNSPEQDPVVNRLDAILALLQDLFILEATRAQVTRGGVRTILGVRNERISRVMKHVVRTRDAGD